MKNNLEHISFDKIVSKEGICYIDFRRTLKPAYKKAMSDILRGHLFLLLILTGISLLIKANLIWMPVVITLGALLIGYTLAYLHLFIHAAAHYNLHPDKQKNDKISDFLIGVFFGIQQKNYRKIHWMHHTNLGTKNDTEHSYFNELNPVFLLKCLAGIHTFTIILSRKKRGSRQPKKNRFPFSFLTYLILFHGVLLSTLFLLGGWKLVATWLIGLLVVFPALAAIRQLLEHRDIHASATLDYHETDHGKVSRLFGDGIVDKSFGAAGFNKHLLHHWDPAVSYTSLPAVEEYLMNCLETSSIIKESKTTYLSTFLTLFKI